MQQERNNLNENLGKWAVIMLYKLLHGFICVALFYFFCVAGLDLLLREAFLLVLLFYLMLIALEKVYNAVNIGNERLSELIISQSVAIFIAFNGMLLVFNLIRYHDSNFHDWLISFSLCIVTSAIWTFYGNRMYFWLYPPLKTLLVHGSSRAVDVFDKMRFYSKKFKITNRIDIAELESGFEFLQDYDAVLLNEVDAKSRNNILKYCYSHGVKAYVRPKIGDLIFSNSQRVKMFNMPMVSIRQNEQNIGYQIIKRAADVVFSLLALVLLSPLMLLIALAIKLCDKGPVFYRQTRLTKGSRVFSIIKFRSMRVDAEKDGVARLSSKNDSRVTKIGRFIRATRLDELPQLINILRGEMSFVGPRPERPEIANQYAENFPEFHLRLLVKAGLTGYAQIYGKYNAEPYDKLQLDLIYIVQQSFHIDLKIMLGTLKPLLFAGDSTEGVREGQQTAAKAEQVTSE